MDRRPLHAPDQTDSQGSIELAPARDLPPRPAPELPPCAARDDDLERRRMELRVYRFLIALYPQLR